MRYQLLGKSGLRVSQLSLGTMTFGEDWGWGSTREESRAVFDAFAEAGGNFIDTANLYTNGTSERLLGEFLHGQRDRFVLASKYSLSLDASGDPNSGGNGRKNMMRAVEASLQRLGTDYLDLYWLHAWDGLTPADEVMRAFDDLVRQGKILHAGISDTPAWVVAHMQTLAQLRSWTPFIALQIEYSLIERTVERDLLPMAEAFGLTVTSWAPLGGGLLGGKYASDHAKTSRGGEISPERRRIADTVAEVARESGHSPAQVALSWVRRGQGHIIPIIGARRVDQLQDNLASLTVTLSESQLATLDEASKVDLGFPHRFLGLERPRSFLTAGMWDRIDRPTWKI